jgi:16S rRNA (uracil1498-N3)-methyltransferase
VTRPVFLCDPDVAREAQSQGVLVLGGREGHHAADVRRLRRGEEVDVVDGHGLRLRCTVTDLGRGQVVLDVRDAVREPVATPRVTVAQALIKHDAADRALSAMTEVGVDEVLPWSAERSVVTWDAARQQRALARWRADVAEAAKQSRRSWVPVVPAPVTTAELANRVGEADVALLLDREAPEPLPDDHVRHACDVLVVVGPEGGMTERDVTLLTEVGARPVHLGPTVLRSATAGAVAAAVVLSRTGRWLSGQAEVPAG